MTLGPKELRAIDELVVRRVREALALADRAGVVDSVNADGSVNLSMSGTTVPSAPALQSYARRAVGERVLVRVRDGEHVVLGPVGEPPEQATPLTITVSNDAAPGGAGWEEASAVWAKGDGLWIQRTVAAPPATGGSVSRGATQLVTYRSGGISQRGKAEQGDYSGRGLQTGLATFGAGAWSGLSGQSPTGGTLTVHRANVGGFTWGKVPMTFFRVLADDPPASTPSLLADQSALVSIAVNETVSVPVPASFVAPFASGAASALACWSTNARDNAEIDALSLTITY